MNRQVQHCRASQSFYWGLNEFILIILYYQVPQADGWASGRTVGQVGSKVTEKGYKKYFG